MPLRGLTDPASVRRRVRKAFQQFTPGQQAELIRGGINPNTGRGVVVTPGTSAVSIRGKSPRIVVGGRGASTSTITHELGHAFLNRRLPRAQGNLGQGVQHIIMGVAGDVGEGPFTATSLVPSRLERAARLVPQAIRRGATLEELGGAAFRGGGRAVRETQGRAAEQKFLRQWRGGDQPGRQVVPPPKTISQLASRPPRKRVPTLFGDPELNRVSREVAASLKQFGEVTTPSRLMLRKKFQLAGRRVFGARPQQR